MSSCFVQNRVWSKLPFFLIKTKLIM